MHESFSFLHFSIDPNNGKLLWPMGFFKFLRIPLGFWMHIKVIYTKYSKHCPYTVVHTIDCVCRKINHGLNHGLFISLFKLISCHIHWIGYVFTLFNISYLNLKADLALPKTASSAQTHKSISFIWIILSTLYVYLWIWHKFSLVNSFTKKVLAMILCRWKKRVIFLISLYQSRAESPKM